MSHTLEAGCGDDKISRRWRRDSINEIYVGVDKSFLHQENQISMLNEEQMQVFIIIIEDEEY